MRSTIPSHDRVLSGDGGLIEKNTPFFTVKTLVTKLLKLDTCKNIHDREALLVSHITEPSMMEMLPLLNDLLGLKVKVHINYASKQSHVIILSLIVCACMCQFPQTPTTNAMVHHEHRTNGLHQLLLKIVHQVKNRDSFHQSSMLMLLVKSSESSSCLS